MTIEGAGGWRSLDDGTVETLTAVVTQTYNARLEPCRFPDFTALQ